MIDAAEHSADTLAVTRALGIVRSASRRRPGLIKVALGLANSGTADIAEPYLDMPLHGMPLSAHDGWTATPCVDLSGRKVLRFRGIPNSVLAAGQTVTVCTLQLPLSVGSNGYTVGLPALRRQEALPDIAVAPVAGARHLPARKSRIRVAAEEIGAAIAAVLPELAHLLDPARLSITPRPVPATASAASAPHLL
jgi:hypothetical protein